MNPCYHCGGLVHEGRCTYHPYPEMLTILSLCDYSGVWSRPYEEAGYLVIRVDLKHGEDVRLFEKPSQRIHGILAAPPCTVFAQAGYRWKRSEADMLEGLSVVDACLRLVAVCNPEWWVLENPMGRLSRYLGPPTMTFQPWHYGDTYTKKTCLWGRFNPMLTPQLVSPGEKTRFTVTHHNKGWTSEETKTARSMTPEGFAKAFFDANP